MKVKLVAIVEIEDDSFGTRNELGYEAMMKLYSEIENHGPSERGLDLFEEISIVD